MSPVIERLSIVQIASSLERPLGGAELYAVELAKELASRGHRVAFGTSWIDDGTRSELTEAGITVKHCKVWRPYSASGKGSNFLAKFLFHGLDLLYSRKVPGPYRWLRDHKGVIHVHRFQGVGAGLLDGTRAPVVHTVHDYALVDTTATSARKGAPLATMSPAQKFRLRAHEKAAQRASMIVFPSERTRERHTHLGLQLAGERSVVIPHGWRLPTSPRDSAIVRSLDFAFVGKLTENKGVRNLIEAWPSPPGSLLHVAGDGPLRRAVTDANHRRVRALGWIDASSKADLLRRSRALVFPSVWPENFPLVVAEAMLAGCPVIATPQSAEPLVRHEVNGLIAEGDGPDHLRAEILRLVSDDKLAEHLSRGALATGRSLSFASHVDVLEELYRSLQSGAQ